MHTVADITITAQEHPDGSVKSVVIQGTLPEPITWDLPTPWSTTFRVARGRVIREVTSDEAEVCIGSLTWRIELCLVAGDGQVGIRAAVECDSQNIRLILPFALGFQTPEDRAWYEIPYGIIERPSYIPMEGVHTAPDGTWPSVHWAAAVNEDDGYTCAVSNRGVPAYRFTGGTMELSLLRSPRLLTWAARSLEQNRQINPLITDSTLQTYELAFMSGAGTVAGNRLVHRGYELNTDPTAVLMAGPEIDAVRPRTAGPDKPRLGPRHSFLSDPGENVMVTAFKLAEDSSGDLVMRLAEVYGQPAAAPVPTFFTGEANEVGPMEDAAKPIGDTLEFGPFQIRTLRGSDGTSSA
jgi:alpha-mannosidase